MCFSSAFAFSLTGAEQRNARARYNNCKVISRRRQVVIESSYHSTRERISRTSKIGGGEQRERQLWPSRFSAAGKWAVRERAILFSRRSDATGSGRPNGARRVKPPPLAFSCLSVARHSSSLLMMGGRRWIVLINCVEIGRVTVMRLMSLRLLLWHLLITSPSLLVRETLWPAHYCRINGSLVRVWVTVNLIGRLKSVRTYGLTIHLIRIRIIGCGARLGFRIFQCRMATLFTR